MRVGFLLIPLIVSGCAGLPKYKAPLANQPTATLKINHDFNAPFLGYSTFVNVHSEEESCGKSFGAESAAQLVILDDSNPLISPLNPDGVNLVADKKYTFMIMSVAGMSNCTTYASFKPKAEQNYEINVSGKLGAYDSYCKAELVRIDGKSKEASPMQFDYYGNCRESNN
ncbi:MULTISPECIES: hypothetical protein [Pseudoalteromonas]|uniref:hypothetical protein n=1 Tax=Pseudoalteromonas TaxID=53246 RepID=UPI0007C5BDEA|nr:MULTISPECIES: hypothetical protein [Pseudoalteromonas]TMO23830.1 hypothetical protein CWC28_18955 [Pseudoalteromonas sp. S4492]